MTGGVGGRGLGDDIAGGNHSPPTGVINPP